MTTGVATTGTATTGVATTTDPIPARTRWQAERSEADSQAYVRRFADLTVQGTDLHGEARFMDAVLAPRSRVLDAGCGTARLGAELARRGHDVLAVDLDPVLVAAAPQVPRLRVQVTDLAALQLDERFDAVVAAGNVMVYTAPGTEGAVVRRLGAHLVRGGVLVTGFATDRPYSLVDFDADAAAAGLELEQRFASWDLRPWLPGADWAVTVLRRRP